MVTPAIMFSASLTALVSNRTHILSALVALEMMALALFTAFNFSPSLPSESYLTLPYLAVSVCEGALGFGILVAFSSSKGSDKLTLFNSLVW